MSPGKTHTSDTPRRIANAALAAFAEYGFDGATTRDIAKRAQVNQGLITYHFQSKEALWRAAMDAVFGEVDDMLATMEEQVAGKTTDEQREIGIHAIVSFFASRPETVRFMVELGRDQSGRMAWLVDRHLSRVYARLPFLSDDRHRRAHEFYLLAGAAALIFAARDECVRLTGVDPANDEAVAYHSQMLARMFSSGL